MMVGMALESGLQELQNVGDEKHVKLRPKYSLDQLLDDEFRLPRPPTAAERKKAGVKSMLAMAKSRKGIGYRNLQPKE